MPTINKYDTIVRINKHKSRFVILENKTVKYEIRFCREIFRTRPIAHSRQNQIRTMPKF